MEYKKIKNHCIIYTDASYDPKNQIGQAASHITWGKNIVEKITSIFPAQDSTEAELIGAYEAVRSMQYNNRNHFLIICDNMVVVALLASSCTIIKKSVRDKYPVIDQFKKLVAKKNYYIITKHIKAHDKSSRSKAAKLNKRVDWLSKTYKRCKEI